ncbi:uncharacterized protein JN550_010002 [Neoarthrinium moseri]|uniref:uncharacterized protein n=1 Tax=Neoarthrinium moseri TaxID=1658444 RepID=UPI001FDDA9BF|nr:uncharacterized protein JN550_010002 [Neoarthrinium moseri]KAI1862855.1 hypothetical protein JN550_010002 [Neoarthrinium moseri]
MQPNGLVSARDDLPPVHVSKRADPPPPDQRTPVSIGEVVREKVDETLYTEGLKTCIAVVVIGEKNVDKASWDKIMAHISSNLCQDGDIPDLDTQLNDLFELDTDTKYIVNRKAYVLTAPDGNNAAQAAFNNYVLQKAQAHWGNDRVQRIDRDQTHVDEPGGSRLWTDGSRNTYWGKNGDLIAPAI